MVAIEVQLPQDNSPKQRGVPTHSLSRCLCQSWRAHLSPPAPTAPSCPPTAAAGLAISQNAHSTENPSKNRGLIQFPSRQASNRLLQQRDLPWAPEVGIWVGPCAQGRTHPPVAAVPSLNLLHKYTHLNSFQVTSQGSFSRSCNSTCSTLKNTPIHIMIPISRNKAELNSFSLYFPQESKAKSLSKLPPFS